MPLYNYCSITISNEFHMPVQCAAEMCCVIIIIIIAEMAVFNVAGYLIEERRRRPVNYCFPTRTTFQINSEFWKKGTFRWENRTSCLIGLETHPTIVPRRDSNSRPPASTAKVSHALNRSTMHACARTCVRYSRACCMRSRAILFWRSLVSDSRLPCTLIALKPGTGLLHVTKRTHIYPQNRLRS